MELLGARARPNGQAETGDGWHLMTRQFTAVRSGPARLLLLIPGSELMNEIRALAAQCIPSSELVELRELPGPERIAAVLAETGPSCCVMDATADPERATALVSVLSSTHNKLPLVTIHTEDDPDSILRSLRQGATDVLVRPLTADQLGTVMEKIQQQIGPGASSQGRVFSVHPAQGACGATTVACNLAWHLKKQGASRVLLADLDPLTGTVSFTFKARSTYSFVEALAHNTGIDADLFRGMVSTVHGIDMLLAPEKPVHGLDEGQDITPVIEFARGLYDIIVLDTSGVYGAWNLSIARHSNEVLLVTTSELQSLQAAQRALAHLERQRIGRNKIRVLVNRFDKNAGVGKDVVSTALHHEISAFLPADKEAVQKAVVDGKAVNGQGGFSRSLQTLSAQLLGKEAVQAPPKRSGLASLLSLFKR